MCIYENITITCTEVYPVVFVIKREKYTDSQEHLMSCELLNSLTDISDTQTGYSDIYESEVNN